LQSDCNAISQRLHCDRVVMVEYFRSKFASATKRFRSDCEVISQTDGAI
jgi:hypothetical protein